MSEKVDLAVTKSWLAENTLPFEEGREHKFERLQAILHIEALVAEVEALRAERETRTAADYFRLLEENKRLANDLSLARAEAAGTASMLLSVQQDCIREKNRADRLRERVGGGCL